MADYDEDFNNLCVNDLCINEYDFEKTSVIRPPEKKNVKLAQRFIFIDSADFTPVENTFTIDFGETINNVVEIELMSCQLPKDFNYPDNYILLFLDNLELANYRKISAGAAVQNCFTRLIIPQKTHNIFFGRIKNFTNTYEFKPKLQKLSKLTLRFTNRSGELLEDAVAAVDKTFLHSSTHSVQLTFAITYQTEPDLFEK